MLQDPGSNEGRARLTIEEEEQKGASRVLYSLEAAVFDKKRPLGLNVAQRCLCCRRHKGHSFESTEPWFQLWRHKQVKRQAAVVNVVGETTARPKQGGGDASSVTPKANPWSRLR